MAYTLNSSSVKAAPTPTDVAVDGDFANWEMVEYPDDWELLNLITEETSIDGFSKTTDKYAGTYALSLDCTIDVGGGDWISSALTQIYDTAVANKTIQARFYAKESTGTPDLGVIAYYYDGSDDYVWDVIGGAWDLAGTEEDGVEPINITGSFAQYTSTSLALPADTIEFWFDIVAIGSQNDVAIVDNVEYLLDGADVASEGGFENWTEWSDYEAPLTDYDTINGQNWEFYPASETDVSYMSRSTSTQAGTYALGMVVGDANDILNNVDRGFVYQSYSGTASNAITASVYTKSTNGKTGYMIFLNGLPGAHTQVWDFVTNSWDALATTVTDLPGTDNALTCSGTGSYVINSEAATIPASGDFVVVLMSDKGDGATQQTYFFDTLVMTTNAGASAKDVFKFTNASNSSNFDSGDDIFAFKTTGGGDYDWLSMDGSGAISTDLTTLDITGPSVTFGTPTVGGNPVTKDYFDTQDALNITTGAIARVGRVSVDFKSTGQTTVYTVPNGYTFYPVLVTVETSASTAPNNDSISTLGTSGGSYIDVTSSLPQPSTNMGKINQALTMQGEAIAAAGGVIQVNVSQADTGTTLNATVSLFGYLIAVI